MSHGSHGIASGALAWDGLTSWVGWVDCGDVDAGGATWCWVGLEVGFDEDIVIGLGVFEGRGEGFGKEDVLGGYSLLGWSERFSGAILKHRATKVNCFDYKFWEGNIDVVNFDGLNESTR
jgi:hypothetical protein